MNQSKLITLLKNITITESPPTYGLTWGSPGCVGWRDGQTEIIKQITNIINKIDLD
jgi:hypothetical protein